MNRFCNILGTCLGLALALVIAIAPTHAENPGTPPHSAPARVGTASQGWASSWLAIAPGDTLTLTHNLGGDVENYAVQLWFLDTDPGGLGIHIMGYGGLEGAELYSGAALQALTSTTVAVHRFPDDTLVDRIRVWVWIPDDPSRTCSGWTDIAPGGIETFRHNLGGDVDDLTVSLWFRENEPGTGLGTHQWRYGGMQDGANSVGAEWIWLSATDVSTDRSRNDPYVDQVNVCVTRPEQQPDYDSTWISVTANSVTTLTHALGGNPNRYIVRMDCNDLLDGEPGGYGINHARIGGDYNTIAPGVYSEHGTHWENLTTSSIGVFRHQYDHYCDEVRVRIWLRPLNTVFLPLALRRY